MKVQRLIRWLVFAFPLLVSCSQGNGVAGGSSGVDNPEVVVAFTNSSGTSASFTGTIRIFPADQNPALDPDAITQIYVRGDTSIKLSRFDFNREDTGARSSYNILLTGDDSSGAVLQNLVYNPTGRKFTGLDSQVISKVRLQLAKMVRYHASLDLANQNSLERVFIPGSPFQSVVVDSQFTFNAIPKGFFPVHLIRKYSEEIPLPESLNTDVVKRFHVDTTASPIPRTQSSPPVMQVNAGGDQTVSLLGETFLSGQLSGVSEEDPRLALLWRQISPDPRTNRAVISNPNLRKTKVTFSQNVLYTFVLTASFEMSLHLQDTVLMNVASMAFIQPLLGDTLRLNTPFNVGWSDPITHASLSLQFSVDGGTNWSVVATGLTSKAGLNSVNWTPTGSPTAKGLLKLIDNSTQVEKARTGLFVTSP